MRERRTSVFEHTSFILGTSLLFFALTACNSAIAINETTIWYGSERMKNDPRVVKHETCHQQQMKDEGGADIFWAKYWAEDNTYRCESELACGETEEHFACQDFKFTIEQDFVVGEIILVP